MTEFSEEYDGSDPLGENIDIQDWDEIDEIFKVPTIRDFQNPAEGLVARLLRASR